jgi:hypothetical protein
MKKLIFIFLILVFTAGASSQEQTLVGDKIESGGFGGMVFKATNINGQSAMFVGGRGGWIINHSFAFGGGGYGLVTNVNINSHDASQGTTNLEMSYGGMDFEYILSSNDLIHFSAGLLLGSGNISDKYEHDPFFVLEPSMQGNLNVTHFFRIAAGASYRYVSSVKSVIVTNADLSGLSAIFELEFGTF